ncbi:MAG: pseudouridine synthase [Myxococcota bacterium]
MHDDGDLIAVDKPAGVPSQAAGERRDDVPARLRRHLEARGEDGYLGIHQRLDQETSGVLVYARRKAMNAGLARAFEGREVTKTYVAAVTGWRGGARTLRDRLASRRGGGTRVLGPRERAKDAREALTHVAVRARCGARALLDVRIETGRTHQIRAQLAHAGAPIAGDGAYGGEPAARLFLHAAGLRLAHPATGRPIELGAPLPPSFIRWLEGKPPLPWEEALDAAFPRRFGLAHAAFEPEATTCFRLVDLGDGVPGTRVDVYDRWAVIHDYGGAPSALGDALVARGFAGVYLKARPKKASDADIAELAPAAPIAGEPAPQELVVREHGMAFGVRLGDGLSTGLFLDQRAARARLRASAAGARVLNLFAYTGPFTVAALAGGAQEVTSVDVSAPALERLRANVARGGFAAQPVVRGDAFRYLERAARQGKTWDVVVCDPPTFATTKGRRWTSGAGWVELAARCFALTRPGGVALLSSNDRRMSQAAFRRHVHEGARAAGARRARLHDVKSDGAVRPPFGTEPSTKRLWAERA